MITELFGEFIERSQGLRPEYPQSLGEAAGDWRQAFVNSPDLPELFEVIYSSVQGTRRGIEDQKLMDFVPGYRLIHVEEFEDERQTLNSIGYWEEDSMVLPLLANYSSDYYCYVEDVEGYSGICVFTHDEGELELLFRTPEKFLQTLIEYYKQDAYYLDDDEYLTYDFEKEESIGLSLNPDVSYWEG